MSEVQLAENSAVASAENLPDEQPLYPHSMRAEQSLKNMLGFSRHLLLKHPSLALTLFYLLASSLGLFLTVELISRFDFSILPYLELTDFLLAAIVNPRSLVISALFFLMYFSLIVLDKKCRQWWGGYAWAMEWTQRMTRWIPMWLSAVFGGMAYLYVSGLVAAQQIYQEIQDKASPEFSLSLIYPMNPGGKETRMLQPVQLISRTSGYLVLYYEKQVMLIPHANVAAFVPLEKSVTAPAGKPAENPPSQSGAATPAAPIKEPEKAA